MSHRLCPLLSTVPCGGVSAVSWVQLKAGLRTPDRLLTGVLLPLRSVREKMKKQMLMTPRMITPEISALVTVFIWKTGAFRWARAVQAQRNNQIWSYFYQLFSTNP